MSWIDISKESIFGILYLKKKKSLRINKKMLRNNFTGKMNHIKIKTKAKTKDEPIERQRAN